MIKLSKSYGENHFENSQFLGYHSVLCFNFPISVLCNEKPRLEFGSYISHIFSNYGYH